MSKKIDTPKKLRKMLIKVLEPLGAINWHSAKNSSSVYIKFKDCRLGSIRISDHNGKTKYSYKYDFRMQDNNLRDEVFKMIDELFAKASSIYGFDKEAYIVYSKSLETYLEIDSLEEYRKIILGQKQI